MLSGVSLRIAIYSKIRTGYLCTMYKKKTLDQLIQAAVDGVLYVNSLSNDELSNWLRNLKSIPASISVGSKRTQLITYEGYRALQDFGVAWRDEDMKTKRQISADQAANLAVKVFGNIVDGKAIDDVDGQKKIKTVFKELLSKKLQELTQPIQHYYPCKIFQNSFEGQFNVGPVHFLDRKEWLKLVVKTSPESKDLMDEVYKHWFGDIKASTNRAKSVLEFVGPYDTISSVKIVGYESKQAEKLARTTCQLAFDGLGLRMPPQFFSDIHSVLSGPFENTSRSYSQRLNEELSWGISWNNFGITGDSEQNSKFIQDTETHRDSLGSALEKFILPNAVGDNAKMYKRWLEALLWFGEARKAGHNHIALVKYGVCLDILTSAGEERGITELACLLLRVGESDICKEIKMPLKKVVNKIYKESRSQFSHGGRLGLMEDMPIPRHYADGFTASILVEYLDYLQSISGDCDYACFLKHISDLQDGKKA